MTSEYMYTGFHTSLKILFMLSHITFSTRQYAIMGAAVGGVLIGVGTAGLTVMWRLHQCSGSSSNLGGGNEERAAETESEDISTDVPTLEFPID